MKLLTKLTLFITLSKLAIVVLFVSFLPSMVSYVAFQFTNSSLKEQKAKVMRVIDKNGIDYYFQGIPAMEVTPCSKKNIFRLCDLTPPHCRTPLKYRKE